MHVPVMAAAAMCDVGLSRPSPKVYFTGKGKRIFYLFKQNPIPKQRPVVCPGQRSRVLMQKQHARAGMCMAYSYTEEKS